MTLSVYRWEDVHLYFPQKVVEQYRKQIIEEWKSDKFKDREIWERYGMSESVFYDLVKRYSKEEDLKDKPSKPKNPSHKLEQEEIQIILDKAREDRDNIKALQSAFENDMKKDGRSLSPKKLAHVVFGVKLFDTQFKRRLLKPLREFYFAHFHPVSYTHLRAHETRHDLVCR